VLAGARAQRGLRDRGRAALSPALKVEAFTDGRQEVLEKVADELELTENSSQKQRRYMT
jgi:hypothetical protein